MNFKPHPAQVRFFDGSPYRPRVPRMVLHKNDGTIEVREFRDDDVLGERFAAVVIDEIGEVDR